MTLIDRAAFESLATAHGFDPRYHQQGVYERFNDYLREALVEAISTALLTDVDDDPHINAAVRKRMRVYMWAEEDE